MTARLIRLLEKLRAALREIAEGAEHWHDNGSDEERNDVLQGIGGMARTALEGDPDDGPPTAEKHLLSPEELAELNLAEELNWERGKDNNENG